MRILLIEDEYSMRMALTDVLKAQGWRVRTASNGEQGLALALSEGPDMIVLDVMLPILDGFEICRELRARGRKMPVLMLTARGHVDDRVTGFDPGADDYLPKPFATAELLARVRALLRRIEKEKFAVKSILIGEVSIDLETSTAHRRGMPIVFTAREMRMLRLMVEENGRPVSRERFIDVVWEANAAPTTRTVDNHILSLRTKLEPDPANPCFIITVHRVGYRLELTDDSKSQHTVT